MTSHALRSLACLAASLAACGVSDDNEIQTGQAVTGAVCPTGPSVSGVDVSVWQGSIDWAAVAASGQAFGITRVSDGTGYADPTFDANWAAMKAAGMIRGAYQYFEPGEDAVAQANLVIAKVGRLGAGDLPVMLDVEATDSSISPATYNAQIHLWVNAIVAGTGKQPIIYVGAYFWDANIGTADFADLPLDIAWYGTNCPGEPDGWSGHPWTIHQYTSTGSVPGIAGDVDVNVYNGSLAQLEAWADGTKDIRAEITIWRPSNGTWYVYGVGAYAWGEPGDIPVPGDYNGDGVADLAIWRPSTGTWWIDGIGAYAWGEPGDVPVPGDYNGDGKTDLAVWRPGNGTWYVYGIGAYQWGGPGDVPVPGDYNGDGTTDIAIWRPGNGTWYIDGIGAGAWGEPGDIPVPGDYNGDGKTDAAVWRPDDGTWYIDGVGNYAWGVPGDIPVPGDYNGDGKTDLAVWRSDNVTWYIDGIGAAAWGQPGDVPVALQ